MYVEGSFIQLRYYLSKTGDCFYVFFKNSKRRLELEFLFYNYISLTKDNFNIERQELTEILKKNNIDLLNLHQKYYPNHLNNSTKDFFEYVVQKFNLFSELKSDPDKTSDSGSSVKVPTEI